MKIPLNNFKRVSAELQTSQTSIYVAPEKRASILLSAIGSNLTSTTQTITLGVSSLNQSNSYYDIIKNFQIPKYDAANLTIGKMVLAQGDVLIASSVSANAINLTLSILETINE